MKKLILLLIAFVASTTLLFAASGTCGANLTWNLTNGVLTISGTGAMDNYSADTNPPWYSERKTILSIVLEAGVTSIGQRTFGSCSAVTSVTIPEGVTLIDSYAFRGCSLLKSITIPSTTNRLGGYVFPTSLEKLYCLAVTPPTIYSVTFYGFYSSFPVYVPAQSVDYYKSKYVAYWRMFSIKALPTYTITWKNSDGTTLRTDQVAYGATPSYTGSTPTRPSTAEYAYTFSGWTPAITAATANKTYTATYTSTPRYTITFNANGGLIPTNGNMGNTPSGHITTLSADRTSGTVVVTKDKTHFQTMTNDCPSREGHTFAGWYTDPTSGVQVYDNTGYRVVGTYWNSEGKWIGTSNVTLYAHWTPIPYTITVNPSNVSQGSATGGGTYDYGTNHQITATPNECYRFVQWSDGNTDNPRTITVNGEATYTAEFEQIQYTIEAQSADVGQGSATVTNP